MVSAIYPAVTLDPLALLDSKESWDRKVTKETRVCTAMPWGFVDHLALQDLREAKDTLDQLAQKERKVSQDFLDSLVTQVERAIQVSWGLRVQLGTLATSTLQLVLRVTRAYLDEKGAAGCLA